MGDGQYDALWLRAKRYCLGTRHARDAEDFASWLVLMRLEGKRSAQQIRDSLTDYLRETYGARRPNAKGLRSPPVVVLPEKPIEEGCLNFTPSPQGEYDILLAHQMPFLTEREVRVINRVRFGIGFEQIGWHEGMTESGISRVLKRIGERRERLEEFYGEITAQRLWDRCTRVSKARGILVRPHGFDPDETFVLRGQRPDGRFSGYTNHGHLCALEPERICRVLNPDEASL